ncbi:MAG TPA: hypothetical protein PKY82_18400 [Pyrinomonadaceae bacterium]|nr:hypothetical protein [Pyrinomonadaceae bacterium]
MTTVINLPEMEWKPEKKPDFRKVKWKEFLAFEVFGVKIGVRSNDATIINRIKEGLPYLLPIDIKSISFEEINHCFSVYLTKRGSPRKIWLNKDDDEIIDFLYVKDKLDFLDSKIRLTVAEFAENFVFLHAGVVGYKGKAILVPARSFSGKTTLVAELAKRGLDYYSDEYAVLDSKGLVHPFTKKLSIRGIIDDYQQVDIDVEELGGKKGVEPLKVGVILISKFKKKGKFNPKIVSSGEGIIESISNSVSIRQNPKFVLQVLSIITNEAKIIKTIRGEAASFADKFLPFLEEIGY